MASILKSTYSK